MKKLNILFLFLFAPVIGFYFAYFQTNPVYSLNKDTAEIKTNELVAQVEGIKSEISLSNEILITANGQIDTLNKIILEQNEELALQKQKLDSLVENTIQQTQKSDVVLEKVLSRLLGDPIRHHSGDNSTIKVYSLNEAGYRGYMAKIRVHNSNALKVVLPDGKLVSNGETTTSAAKRTGAILAVNGGGFWRNNAGKLASIGTIVVNGEILQFSNNPNTSFVGFNTKGHLVGGVFQSREQLKNNNIIQGASFVPTLLEDGKKTKIPSEWANARHPRTIVGNFSNGELLFIVIDGRRTGWSNGVTLEELQDKLLSFKIKDAFNLDGGGSSAFYFNGETLNKPSDGRQRPVSSNIIIMP